MERLMHDDMKMKDASGYVDNVKGISNSPGKEKWIQNAIKKPGALHREMGVPMGSKIPAKALSKAASSSGLLGKRARLAQTLNKMHKY